MSYDFMHKQSHFVNYACQVVHACHTVFISMSFSIRRCQNLKFCGVLKASSAMYSKTAHCVKSSERTSGQMVSTYRTNCTETEQICRGQRSTSDERDWLSRKSEREREEESFIQICGITLLTNSILLIVHFRMAWLYMESQTPVVCQNVTA
jgi:hypothetical protein